MRATTSILTAGLAALAMAAPTPKNSLAKRSFKVPSKGHTLRAPLDEMCAAFEKHGWEIIWLLPGAGSYGSPSPEPSSSAALGGGYGAETSSCTEGYGAETSSAPAYGAATSSFAISAVPSSSFPSYEPGSSGIVGPSGTGRPSGVAMPTGSEAPVPTQSSEPSSIQSVPIVPGPSSAPSWGWGSSSAPSWGWGSSTSASPPAASSGTPTGDGEVGEVTATPEQFDSEYLSPVSIGGQTLNLNFDTGSADLWVFSSEMSTSASAGHSVFNPDKSDTWEADPGSTWQIQYGDGSTAGGIVGFDEVSIGDATVTRQAVELATQVASQFTRDENSDGLVGLSFSVLNTIKPEPQKTWFDNIKDQLDEPLFTADLEENASGTYEFGYLDHSKYSGELHYTPIDNSDGWWQFPSESVTIGGETVKCSTCSPAIADTGTSLALLDDDMVAELYKKVPGAKYDSLNGGYVFPCDAEMPDFGIAIGPDYTAVLKGKELIYADVEPGVCFGGIQGNGASQGSGTPVQIIGAVLLKQYFAVFDAGNMQFGIAKKN